MGFLMKSIFGVVLANSPRQRCSCSGLGIFVPLYYSGAGCFDLYWRKENVLPES